MRPFLVELARTCGMLTLVLVGALAYAGFWFGLTVLSYWIWPWLALPVGCIAFTMVLMAGPILCEVAAAVKRRQAKSSP